MRFWQTLLLCSVRFLWGDIGKQRRKAIIIRRRLPRDGALRSTKWRFGPPPYICRLAAALRCFAGLADLYHLRFGNVLAITAARRYDSLSVECGGSVTELPRKEFQLLYKLLSCPDKTYTRRQLMDEIWDLGSDSDEHTVNVHINRLRDRLKENRDFAIVTVRGLGYKAVRL